MSVPVLRLDLPRKRRITRSGDFARTRNTGRRLAVGSLVLNWVDASGEQTRLGVITSRKVGNAVARSRARRLLREAFRRNQHQIKRVTDVVLVARPSIAGKGYEAVQADLLTAFGRAELLA